MKKKYTIFCLLLCILTMLVTMSDADAQNTTDQWARFNQKNSKGLNLDANVILDSLEATALREHDTLQLFRVHFERAILLNTYNQQHEKAAILFVDSVMRTSSAPYRNLYERMMGQYLHQYYKHQMYVQDKREVPSDTSLANLDQWNAEILQNAILQHQQASQTDGEILKKYPLKDFLFFFQEEVPVYKYESATLYDLIFGVQVGTTSTYYKAVLYYDMAQKSGKDNDWLVEAHRLFTQLLDSPKSLERHNAKAYLQAIEQPDLQVVCDVSKNIINAHKLLLPVQYRNVDTLYVTCLKKTRNQFPTIPGRHPQKISGKKVMCPDFCFESMIWLASKYLDSMRTERFVLPDKHDYYEQTTDLFLDSLGNGNYIIVFHNNPKMDTNTMLHAIEISICDKDIVREGSFGSKKHYRVVDAASGAPASDVKVLGHHYGIQHARRSDADGVITLPNKSFSLKLPESPKNVVRSKQDWSGRYNSHFYSFWEKMWMRRYQRGSDNSLLITDRTIYRPGQTLYFKAISFNKTGKKVDADREVEIYFKSDNNRKKIDSLRLVTNAFGSVDSSFTLPANLEPGNYKIIQTKKHSRKRQYKSFRVEEYKRPTFELTMDTIKDAYTLGDTVNLWGKATYYSGLPVPGASVRVTVKDLSTEWNASTNPAGYFRVAIPTALLPTESYHYNWSQVTANIVVSEPNGETQTTKKTFAIAGKSLTLKINKQTEHVNTAISQQLPITISLTNQDGAAVPNKFRVSVCRLDVPARQHYAFAHNKPSLPLYSPADYQRTFPVYSFDESECVPEKFKALRTVWEQTSTDTTIAVNVQNWETGLYKMVVQTTDPHGKTVQDSTLFSVVGKGAFKQTTNIYAAIFDDIDSSFKESGMLHYCIGSSTIPNANVYYHISYDGKIVKQGRMVMTDTLLTDSVFIEIPEKSIRGKAEISAYTFYHNHLYQINDKKMGFYDDALLKSLENDMQAPLQIQVEHVNDKLNPGTQETWSFTIKGKDSSQHPDAEMLAMLYDASLDPLTKDYWFLKRDFSEYDNNSSFALKDLKMKRYLPLYKDHSRVFVKPDLLEDGQYQKKNNKKLPKLSLWDAQLPSLRFFTSDFYPIYTQYTGTGNSIIKGQVVDQAGEPLAYSRVLLTTTDNITINMAMTDEYGCYSLYGVPTGLFSLTADAQMTCKRSQTKTNIKILSGQVLFVDFHIDCSSALEEVVITYEPPVFDADRTTSVRGNRSDGQQVIVDGVRVRSTPGRSVSSALSSLEGTASVDGEMTSVRGIGAYPNLEDANQETAVKARREMLGSLQPRTDFAETAFFLPELRTDENGRVSFQFKAPDQLTRWHFAALAHTKDRHITTFTQDVYTQRALMLMPNVPRFVREGDILLFRSNILAMNSRPLHGDARLEMWDTLTQRHLEIANADQPFRCDSAGSALATWTIAVPQHIRNLQYKLAAVGTMPGYTFSDAETRNVPVLPQTIDLNETMPFHITKDSSARIPITFTVDGTRTLHISTHPTWAIYQTLPYIINSRHECNDELMYKYFTNTLAQRYLKQHPLLLQRAELDEETRNLFDPERIQKELQQLARKLKQRQNLRGGWGWMDGNYIDDYITTRIATHLGQLSLLGEMPSLETAGKDALQYLCDQETEEYTQFLEDTTPNKQFSFGLSRIQFLYALSYYTDWQKEWLPQAQMDFYLEQAENRYLTSSLREKAMIAIACQRLGRPETAAQWAEALRQQAHKDAYGLSWTELRSRQRGWHDVAVNTEALLMELFSEALPDSTETQQTLKEQTLAGITQWLLAQRTTNHWDCNSTNTAVCFALALQEKNANVPTNNAVQDVVIRYGDSIFHHPDTMLCGSYELTGAGNNAVTIENHSTDAVYGSVWLQYQQTLDSVKAFGSEEIKINRTLHRRSYNDTQAQWQEIAAGDTLHVGDILTVRFVIENARNMDYVNISDMRACAFEPIEQTSQWRNNGDFRWYESPRDQTTEFYITHLDRGTHVLEYTLKVTHAGVFSNGTATIESMLAPVFTAHSDSPKLHIR